MVSGLARSNMDNSHPLAVALDKSVGRSWIANCRVHFPHAATQEGFDNRLADAPVGASYQRNFAFNIARYLHFVRVAPASN